MSSPAGSFEQKTFGNLPGGEEVLSVTLAHPSGLCVRLLTYGASVQSVLVPDRRGQLADVALGHDQLAGYLHQPQYFGATVGRVANRIAGGRFSLDGKEYRIPTNNGPNALHGGPDGYDKRNWSIVTTYVDPVPGVTMQLVSPDGDQGFPGALTVTADFQLTLSGALRIEYRATTDSPTVVNLSNHSYWNLAGEGSPESAVEHDLTIFAEHYLPTNASSIPTGEFAPVVGTPFDFREATRIGARVRDARHTQIVAGRGYDHNWVAAIKASDELRKLARAEHPGSGRVLEVQSNQPGVQFYSGNFLDGTSIGKTGQAYRMGDALVLEPQMFPDTPNQPAFGSLRLDPGQVYRNVIEFRFSTDVAERVQR